MNEEPVHEAADIAPGDSRAGAEHSTESLTLYAIGLGLAVLLTAVAFVLAQTHLVWGPSIPVALSVLAIGQMGVHLTFFLHLTSGPDNINNIMALAFGVVIVFLIIVGSLFIMDHLNHNMMPMASMMQNQP